jgi:hypothetical protein
LTNFETDIIRRKIVPSLYVKYFRQVYDRFYISIKSSYLHSFEGTKSLLSGYSSYSTASDRMIYYQSSVLMFSPEFYFLLSKRVGIFVNVNGLRFEYKRDAGGKSYFSQELNLGPVNWSYGVFFAIGKKDGIDKTDK